MFSIALRFRVNILYVFFSPLFLDWDQAIRIGVLDCADEKNFEICKEFGIHFYPTFRVC